jgi:O-antigen biosynthesis protein WbqV
LSTPSLFRDFLQSRMVRLRALAFAHDNLMAAVAFLGAMVLRVGLDETVARFGEYWPALVLFVLIAAAVGPLSGLNGGIWRYASLSDLVAIVRAATITVVIFTLLLFLLDRMGMIPRTQPILAWILLILLLAGPRSAYRIWRIRHATRRIRDTEVTNALLIGAGDGADGFIKTTLERADLAYRVVGVIDASGRRVGRFMRGVQVLGGIEDIPAIVRKLTWMGRDPQVVVLTKHKQALSPELIDRVLDICQSLNLALLSLPDIPDLDNPGGIGFRLKPVKIEDLLQRDPAHLDMEGASQLTRNRRVLITGAGGSIGSELCRQIAAIEPASLAILDNSEYALYLAENDIRDRFPNLPLTALIADVRDRTKIDRIFGELRPEIVFHAAALKHLHIVERQPLEGIHTNVLGTRNVADAARKVGARAMVLISTDKAIRPSSLMGASKRLAEMYCQGADLAGETRFITVRFGNVLGSTGSVVPLFEKQLAKGGPLTVTHPEMQRYFMTIPEAVQLVLQAAKFGMANPNQRGNILVLDMGQPVKILDLARRMIRLQGLRPNVDVKIVFTGVRPGEKLNEELLDAKEPPIATDTSGVFVALPRNSEQGVVEEAVAELEHLVELGNVPAALRAIIRAVPEYQVDARIAKRYGLGEERRLKVVGQAAGQIAGQSAAGGGP